MKGIRSLLGIVTTLVTAGYVATSLAIPAVITPVACDGNIYVTFDYYEDSTSTNVNETIIITNDVVGAQYNGDHFNIDSLFAAHRFELEAGGYDAAGTITFTNADVTAGPFEGVGFLGLEGNDVLSLSGTRVLDFDLHTNSSVNVDRFTVTLQPDDCGTIPVAEDDTAEVDQDSSVNIAVLSNDDFGDDAPSNSAIEVTVDGTNGSAVVNDNATPTDPTDDTIEYTPDASFYGTDTFTYEICDEDDQCDTAEVEVTVNQVITPVACDAMTYITLNYNESNSAVDVNESFVFSGTLTTDDLEIVDLGAGVYQVTAFENNHVLGSISFTNVAIVGGPDYIVDGSGLEANDVVTIVDEHQIDIELTTAPGYIDQFTVDVVADPACDPDAQDDSDSMVENNTLNIDVLANDDFGLQGPSSSAISIFSAPSYGSAVVDDNGTPSDPTDDTIDYTPDVDYTGSDSFEYEICDANGDCDTATVTIDVLALFPVACDGNVYLTLDYYERNSDTVVSKTYFFTGAFSNDHISIAQTDIDTYTLTVLNGNDVEGNVSFTNVIVTSGPDYIIGGDGIEPAGANGDYVFLSGDASFEMDLATNGAAGIDQFSFVVAQDPACDPDAQDDTANVLENSSININVLANDDFGLQGPSASTISIDTPATNGTATVNDGGTDSDPTDDTIHYSPDDYFTGSDSFVYEICDAGGDCDTALVEITINPITPVVCNDTFYLTFDYEEANGPSTVNKTIILGGDYQGDHFNILDLGGNEYRIALKNNYDVEGTLTLTNAVVITGPENTSGAGGLEGNDLVELTNPNVITVDMQAVGNVDRFRIEVAEDPACDGAPVAEDDGVISVAQDQSKNIDVLDNDDFGINGPSDSAITIDTQATNGTATVDDNGTPSDPTDDTIDYMPNIDFVGTDSFVYQICDSDDDCDTATVEVDVYVITPVACDDNIYVTFDYDETWSTNASIYKVAVLDGTASTQHFTIENIGGDLYQVTLLDGNTTAGTITFMNAIITGGPSYSSGGNGLESNDSVVVNGEYELDFELKTSIPWYDQFTIELGRDVHCTTPTAEDDSADTDQNTSINIDVLANDDFGFDGANSSSIQVTSAASNGTATVNDAGTASDPTDDTIDYVPSLNYYGDDLFSYEICDTDGDCDTADVTVDVNLVPQVCDAYIYLTFDYYERNTDTVVSDSIIFTGTYDSDFISIETTGVDTYRVTIKNGFDVEGSFTFTNGVIVSGPTYIIGGDGIEPTGANGDYVFASSTKSFEMDLATNGAAGIDQFSFELSEDLSCSYGKGGGGSSVGGGGPSAVCKSQSLSCTQTASDSSTGCVVGEYSDVDDTSTHFRWMCTSGDTQVTCQSLIETSCESTLLDTGAPEEITYPPLPNSILDTGFPETKPGYCGDHLFDEGEQCDDGNNLDGDGCNKFCVLEGYCGNHLFDAGEQCDDGNYFNNDGCDKYCRLEGY